MAEMMLAVMLRGKETVMTVDQLKVTCSIWRAKRLCICGSLAQKGYENLQSQRLQYALRDKAERWVFERSKLSTMI